MPQLQQRLAVIVACTSGKTVAASPTLQVRSLPHGPGRLEAWTRSVASADGRTPLRRLYKGQQWQSSLALEAGARDLGHKVELWVASAGLGLRPVNSPAPAYAASFSPGDDAVAHDLEGARNWWQGLHRAWRSQTTALCDLEQQVDQVLIVLAPSYLQVLEPGLADFEPATTAIVTSKSALSGVYSSSGLRAQLGGSALSLNPRAALQLLRLAGRNLVGSTVTRDRWMTWAQDRRTQEPPDGRRLGDATVLDFIRSQLASNATSRTALLRQLRAAGMACEQRRFAGLYEAAKREIA